MPTSESAALNFALVVDDNRDYADALCELIATDIKWQAEAAYSAGDAVDKAYRTRPQVAFLDLHIGRGSGFSVVEHLRGLLSEPVPLLFAVSGDADLLEAASNDRRFDGAFLKPVDPDMLRRCLVEAALRASASRK